MKTYAVNASEFNSVCLYKKYVESRVKRANNEQKDRFQTELHKVSIMVTCTLNNNGGRLVKYVNANQYGYWKAIAKWVDSHIRDICIELGTWTAEDERRHQRLAEIRARKAA